MYTWTPDTDTEEDEEELLPKVAYSTILQEEEYEDEDADPVAIQGWDPRESQIFFHIQY